MMSEGIDKPDASQQEFAGWINVREAADRFVASESTIRRHIKGGLLRSGMLPHRGRTVTVVNSNDLLGLFNLRASRVTAITEDEEIDDGVLGPGQIEKYLATNANLSFGFAPHPGLGAWNELGICPPAILNFDASSLLLFDKVFVEDHFWWRMEEDELEGQFCQALKEAGVLEVVSLVYESHLQDRCLFDFRRFHEEMTDEPFPTEAESLDSQELYNFCNHKFGRNIGGLFEFFCTCHLALQIAAELQCPVIQPGLQELGFYDFLIDRFATGSEEDRATKARKHFSQGAEVAAYKALFDLHRVHVPTLPVLINKKGKAFQPMPGFMRTSGFILNGDEGEDLDEDQSKRQFDRLIELREHKYVAEFRAYLKSVSAESATTEEPDRQSLIVRHRRETAKIEIAILNEFRWIELLTKLSTYLSVPVGLLGLWTPAAGLAGIGLGMAALTGYVAGRTIVKKTLKDPGFALSHENTRWYFYYQDLSQRLTRQTVIGRLKSLL